MKRQMRRLFSVMLCLVMLFGIMPTAHAANSEGITYTATLDKDTIAPSDEAQTVVMTVKANKKFDVDATDMTAEIPEGWTIASIENEELGFTAANVNLEKGRANYATPDAENWQTDLVVVVTYNVPANTPEGAKL